MQKRLTISRSYQLKADIPTGGTTSGALVHFTEASMGQNLTTDTPWIAYISCDRNESEASQYWGACGRFFRHMIYDGGLMGLQISSRWREIAVLCQQYVPAIELNSDLGLTRIAIIYRDIAELSAQSRVH